MVYLFIAPCVKLRRPFHDRNNQESPHSVLHYSYRLFDIARHSDVLVPVAGANRLTASMNPRDFLRGHFTTRNVHQAVFSAIDLYYYIVIEERLKRIEQSIDIIQGENETVPDYG